MFNCPEKIAQHFHPKIHDTLFFESSFLLYFSIWLCPSEFLHILQSLAHSQNLPRSLWWEMSTLLLYHFVLSVSPGYGLPPLPDIALRNNTKMDLVLRLVMPVFLYRRLLTLLNQIFNVNNFEFQNAWNIMPFIL